MTKRKRKSKENRNANWVEFITPLSFEECVSRLPKHIILSTTRDTCEFEIEPNINDKRNQSIFVWGQLHRMGDETLVAGEAGVSLFAWILPIAVVVGFIAILGIGAGGGFTNYIPATFVVFGLILGGIWHSLVHRRNQLLQSVFAVFQPVRKVRDGTNWLHLSFPF